MLGTEVMEARPRENLRRPRRCRGGKTWTRPPAADVHGHIVYAHTKLSRTPMAKKRGRGRRREPGFWKKISCKNSKKVNKHLKFREREREQVKKQKGNKKQILDGAWREREGARDHSEREGKGQGSLEKMETRLKKGEQNLITHFWTGERGTPPTKRPPTKRPPTKRPPT